MQRLAQLIRSRADPNAQDRQRHKRRDRRTRPRADALPAANATRVTDYPRLYTELDDLSDLPWADFHSQLARPRHVSSGVSPHLHYVPYEAPTKVRVKRGEYQSLVDFIQNNRRFGTVVGPTACGKSSYALLPILEAGKSVLLVQPSPTNVASCMANFAHRIPAAIETRDLPFSKPNVAHCGFITIVDSPAQINICESKDLEDFFDRHGTFPPVDVILLDEYHLPRPEHVRMRIILTHVSTMHRPPTIIFASATPPDEEPPPVRTSGLTINTQEIPDPLTMPVPVIYQLSKHVEYGNMMLLIIADSCPAAHTLVSRLASLGERVALLCPCVTREAATEWLRRETHNITFVATPDTEAGLDTSCSHMVNPGTAVRTIFENGVLYSSVFRLGPRQNVQRLGRAGRSRHTIVYNNPGVGKEGLDSCSPVDAATACMKVLNVTGQMPDSPDCKAALEEFPRLAKVTQRAIAKALRARTPVLELYRRNKNGDAFKEFGGEADGFVEECGADLRLFIWKGGRAFSPFLNLTAYHNPTEGQTIESLKSLSEAALKERPHLVSKLDIYKALDFADQEPEAFSQAIWLALNETRGESNYWTADDGMDLARVPNCETSYMFGDLGNRAWLILERLGGSHKPTFAKGPPDHKGRKLVHRTLHFRGDRFNFCSTAVLGDDRRVSNEKVTDLLYPHLKPVSITYLLQDDRQLCTNLHSLKHVQDSFPVTCALGHGPVVLENDQAFVSHHTSEHDSLSIIDYRAALGKQKPNIVAPAPIVKSKAHPDALARHGIILDSLMSLTNDDTTSGGLISIRHMQSFLSFLGDLHGLEVWYGKLQIDLFKLILLYKGTDEVNGLGSIDLMSPDMTVKKSMEWTEFQTQARVFFEKLGIQFTFRRCAKSFGDLYWTFWEEGVPGIADIKEGGTPHSREYLLKNGTVPPAWVLVPDLFGDRLTKEEAELRVADSKKADVNKGKVEEITYTGLDQNGIIDSHFDDRVVRQANRRKIRLMEGNGGRNSSRLGVGHHARSGGDSWSQFLGTLSSPYDA